MTTTTATLPATLLAPFVPTDPLVPGTTLVEASAGTGKTYNITNLVVRLVAEEGLGIDRILVVTFTNAATAELKERIHRRLGEAISALEGAEGPPDDPVFALLAEGAPEARAERVRRLRSARRDFDAAAIHTIHGFCQRVLQRHAFESGAEFAAELVQDVAPLVEEVVDDALSESLWGVDDETCAYLVEDCGLGRDALLGLAWAVAGAADAVVEPRGIDLATWRARRDAFAETWEEGRGRVEAVLADAAARKLWRRGQRTYGPAQDARHLQEISEWLRGGPRFPLRWKDLPKAFLHLTRDKVEEYGEGRVADPLFGEWQGLLRLGEEAIAQPRVEFAHRVRRELEARLSRRGQISFDALLRRVRDRVLGEGSEALVAGLRARFRAALLDEFQDTDAVQWGIFQRVFAGDPGAFLYLIGDPKQAIYSFRGADILTYRRAARTAGDRRFGMDVNRRSDGRYVAAMNALFREPPGVFGLDFVRYQPVRPAEANRPDRLVFSDGRAPLRIRWFDQETSGDGGPPGGALTKGRAWPLLPSLVAGEVAGLLEAGRLLRWEGGALVPDRPLGRRDVAVLVRKNAQARQVHRALLDRGIPAVIAQAGSVWESDEALALLGWLEALESPDREGPAIRLAASPLVGWTAGRLHDALAGEAAGDGGRAASEFAELRAKVARWAGRLERAGFSAAVGDLLGDPACGIVERLCSLPDGERRLTNLRHAAERLHVAATRERLGPAGLARHLRRARLRGDGDAEAAELRLESDSDAVHVVTLHKSKGLEYPVVLLPYLWDGGMLSARDKSALRYPREDGTLGLDLGMDPGLPPKDEHVARAEADALQEALRLLYVGFTRARHHAVAWWGPVNGADRSPLGVVLHGGGEDVPEGGRADRARARIGVALKEGHDALHEDLRRLAGARGEDGRPLVEVLPTPVPRGDGADEGPGDPDGEGLARVYARGRFDDRWRRHSYSSLVRGHGGAAHPPPPDREALDHDGGEAEEEGVGAPSAGAPAGPWGDEPVPLAGLARGEDVGTLVHKVLELLDFQTLDEKGGRRRPLSRLVEDLGRRMGLPDPAQVRLLVDAVPGILATPLGEAVGGLRLADLAAGDRLDELRFDVPIARGTRWRNGKVADGAEIAGILGARPDRSGPSAGDVLTDAYLAGLRSRPFGPLCGFLTGSIDLVFRRRDAGGERYFVCDYKTNRLGPPGAPGRPGPSLRAHYTFPWLRREMERHDYYVQYHLYLVALHRLLRARLGREYDYDRHVGGAAYLFVRGMVGEAAASPPEGGPLGIFFDRPPREVVVGLSRLLDPDTEEG